jgi:CRISPR/Cas system-associated endonuclease Cas1
MTTVLKFTLMGAIPPLVKIDDVAVMGEVTLTASALHLLLERNIEITFLGHYGQFKGRLSPPFSKNAMLRMAQYRAHSNMPKRCELAAALIISGNCPISVPCYSPPARCWWPPP